MIHEAIETPAAEASAGPTLHVERDALHDALQLLCRIVERRNTIPILSYLLFEPLADASGVAITATDLDLQLTLNVRYNSAPEGGGRFCVPAFTLADMVKKAEKGAHLELTLRDGRLEMMHGRTRGKLTPLPADDFPLMVAAKEGETPVAFTLPAEQFAGDLARVAWAQGKEETRYYLLGTALQMREGAFTMAATDGHNLAWIDRALGCDAFPDVILPRKAGDMIRRIVKGRAPAELGLAITESRIVAEAQGLCLMSKAIDGSFPDWRKVPDGLPAELQLVAMPEIEPRMPLPAVEMCAKAIGGSPIVEMGTDCVRLTLPAAPEFTAIAMMLKADALPKGYAYEASRDGHEQARGYLRDLATAADLPLFHSEYTDHEQKVRQHEETRLIIVDGLILGACFGEQTSRAGKDHEYVEEPDYETLTMRTVKREVMRSDAWQDGAYCVAMPRERAGMAAAVTMGTPGVDERAVATKNDAILLDAKAIAALAGDPAEWVRVEIKPYPMHHGRRLPDGFVVPFAPLTQQPDAKGRSKLRHMSDREVTRAYCEDPAGLMAKLQPQPTAAATGCRGVHASRTAGRN
jgi:DNA polymerase III sliding clamp (beta) subunit (PCNA family)